MSAPSTPVPEDALQHVGQSAPRVDLPGKVTGSTPYTADLSRPGMLHGRILRSPHPHARVRRIDASRALAVPGVHAVLTHEDVPAERIDADLLVLDPHLRFVGDEVAAVAAETPEKAEDALALIQVDFEVLSPVYTPQAALAPDAPLVQEAGNRVGGRNLQLERGDARRGLAAAARVFEGRFRTQIHAPVGMETRAALAEWKDGHLTVWKTSRAVHANDRRGLSRVLGLPEAQIRVICTAMGGGFGNKDEGRLSYIVALLAKQAGRPVRISYSRAEEYIAGRNRQSSETALKIGVDASGAPVAVHMRSLMNAGAYVASGINVTRRTGQGALYLYACPNAHYEGVTAYTTRPAGGSFRGLGAPLGHFALEVLIDQICADLGQDPLDYRLAHHVPPEGQPGARTTPPGQYLPDEPVEGGVPFSSNGLRACLLAGAERIGWRERRAAGPQGNGTLRRGIGCAMGIYKGGVGREAQADVRAQAGGVTVAVGNVDVGQGSTTVLAQMAAEALQVPLQRVHMTLADTETTPPGHITAGSSTTFSSGSAVKLAAETVRNRLMERAAAQLGAPSVTLSHGVFQAPGGATLAMSALLDGLSEPVQGHATVQAGSAERIINAFAAHFAEVEVDLETGRLRVLRYVAAQDSGRIVNPRLAQGQVSGAVLQFLGIALREELLLDEPSGVTLNPSFLEHKSTSIVDFPPIEVLFCGEPDPLAPFGAKALGEPPVVPVFAAIANAVAHATGAWLNEAPFTPRRVLDALAQAGVRP